MLRFVLVFSVFVSILSVFLPVNSHADVNNHLVLASVGYHSMPNTNNLVIKSKHIKLEHCKDAHGSLGLVNVSFEEEKTKCPPGYVATQEVKTGVTDLNKAHLVCCQANLYWD